MCIISLSQGIRMRREKLEITIEILEFCKTEARKTNLVYGVNINFELADRYLTQLIAKGFVEKRGDKFITTKEGKCYLEKASEVLSLL